MEVPEKQAIDSLPQQHSPLKTTMARRLRIAVTVLFAILAIMACILWVASYRKFIYANGRLPGECSISTHLLRGSMAVWVSNVRLFPTWGVGTHAPDEYRATRGFADPRIIECNPIFYANLTDRGLSAQFSIGVPALFFAGVAGMSWARVKFSLRTLLIAMTLLALLLGLAVWAAR